MVKAKCQLPERFAKDGSRGLRTTSRVPVNWGQCENVGVICEIQTMTSIVSDHIETLFIVTTNVCPLQLPYCNS